MKIKSFVLIVAVFCVSDVIGDDLFGLRRQRQAQTCSNGSCSNVRSVRSARNVVAVAPVVQAQTTVINNLVGIPVPVTYSQPLQAQGSTIYGYSAYSQNYNNVDLSLLYNQAARLTDQAQQLSAQANQSFVQMVQLETEKQAELAQIIAQGQAAQRALQAAKPLKTQSKSFSFKITQDSDGNFTVEQAGDQPQNQSSALEADVSSFDLTNSQKELQVSNILKQSCVKCHSNVKASGGLNLEQAITPDQQLSIIDRIITDDPAIRMPKGGKKLSLEHIELIKQVLQD